MKRNRCFVVGGISLLALVVTFDFFFSVTVWKTDYNVNEDARATLSRVDSTSDRQLPVVNATSGSDMYDDDDYLDDNVDNDVDDYLDDDLDDYLDNDDGDDDGGLVDGRTPVHTEVDVCEESARDFRAASGLFAIVTGAENSGTTIVSELIMSAPGLFGALESGLLCSDTPKGFVNVKPFYQWVKPQYGLTENDRESLINASCHAEMYAQLRQRSFLFQHAFTNSSLVVDKTPRYVYKLTEVMDRTPGVPVVVTQKSDEDQIKSYMKRSGGNLARVPKSKLAVENAREKYPDRLFVVNMTQLYNDPDYVMSDVFDFLGLEWKHEYLSMEALNYKLSAVGITKTRSAFDSNAPQSIRTTMRYEGDGRRPRRPRATKS